jgi:acetyl-CoA/propionyl-CoA carboxylase biotin carboxyl carrier protein
MRAWRAWPCTRTRIGTPAAAGGAGECFAERYLDHARHLETQCLADRYGNVAVISTRDCSLQRRHQKIVEEAPAPFLDSGLDARLRAVSSAILRAASYAGAATCEFLLGQDGTLAFLETNARLAVAHPVSEEVSRLDLVRETFRIAEGDALGYGDPEELRACAAVPDLRRGSWPRLRAGPGHRAYLAPAVRPWRAA